MISTLSFSYKYRTVDPLLEVGIVIDGVHFLPHVVASASQLLESTSAREVFLFTCSCGNAGCADIFHPVVMTNTRKHIEWTFPNPQGYRLPIPGKTTYTFCKEQYKNALRELRAQLQMLSMSHPDAAFYENGPPVMRVLREQREYWLAHRQRDRADKELMGYLQHCRISVALPGAVKMPSFEFASVLDYLRYYDVPDIEGLLQTCKREPQVLFKLMAGWDWDDINSMIHPWLSEDDSKMLEKVWPVPLVLVRG